jgi:L-asparaginase
MAYTASALSFGLQNLDKPVILTGSQVPMSSLRSDARRNLVNAIEMATLPLFEVAICFNDFVYRGNRSTKMSIGDFDAFASPNFPPLAEIGLHIEFNKQVPRPQKSLNVFPHFSDRIFLLKLFPNLSPNFLEQLDLSELDAIILEAFGSGNFPMHGKKSVLPFLKRSIAQDLIVIITSQAPYDAVDLTKYESGRKAMDLGALSARDMTSEAALTKMMHLLSNYEHSSKIKELFQKNIAGEVTAET